MLAAVLAAWLVRSRLAAEAFDWSLAVAAVTRLHWPWLLLALIPIFGTYYGRALRWEVFLRPQKAHPSMRNLLVATVIGFTAITLFGRAGDFVRPYLIAVKEKVPITSQLASWLLERVFDLLMASLLLGFALTRLQGAALHVGAKLAWVLAFGGRIVASSCLAVLAAIVCLTAVRRAGALPPGSCGALPPCALGRKSRETGERSGERGGVDPQQRRAISDPGLFACWSGF